MRYFAMVFAFLGLVGGLAGCGDADQPKPQAVTQQQKFCAAVDQFRVAYAKTSDKPSYLDQDSDLKALFNQRNAAIQTILGSGAIVNWTGKVRSLIASEKGAYLTVDLGCGALLAPTDAQIVKKDSPVYQQLRALHEGSSVTVSGSLVPPDTTNRALIRGGFQENSITDAGSMRVPEMVFVVKSAAPI